MDLANRMYLHLLCLGQVVETYNSHIERMVRFINPMTIMRSQGMIEVTGSIHNGRLREKSYARAVISYGEEKPLSKGAGESAWGQNRRAEFKAIK